MLDIKVRAWLLEYREMLKRESKKTNIPLFAKRYEDKSKKINEYLYGNGE